ncbi:MAG TPA: hypothetical protein VGI32_10775 [Steroidobacteraceae bacterium]|jgi:hypothetical protein
MWPFKNIALGVICCLPIIAAHAQSNGSCEAQLPPHQQKDEATIQKIETSWNLAIARGDSRFERCLLTGDFVEILNKGEVKTLTDELGFTEKNQGKNRPIPTIPPMTVLIHGNVGVAYAIWVPTDTNKKPDKTADYFIWENGAWHVFFSQSTPVDAQ